MRYTYDFEVDALYLYLRPGSPVRQVEVGDVTVDLDDDDQIVGVEVIGARLGWDAGPVIESQSLRPDEAKFLRYLAAWRPDALGGSPASPRAVGHSARVDLSRV